MTSKSDHSNARKITQAWFVILLAAVLSLTGCSSSLSTLTVEIGHRLYPAFHDTVLTKLNEKSQVADTEFSFKTTEFYPHFTIIDSTKKIVSLSEDPVNPAFKIKIYKNGKFVDETWAFFGSGAPHYARTSFLTFRITAFTYRGEMHDASKKGSGNHGSNENQ